MVWHSFCDDRLDASVCQWRCFRFCEKLPVSGVGCTVSALGAHGWFVSFGNMARFFRKRGLFLSERPLRGQSSFQELFAPFGCARPPGRPAASEKTAVFKTGSRIQTTGYTWDGWFPSPFFVVPLKSPFRSVLNPSRTPHACPICRLFLSAQFRPTPCTGHSARATAQTTTTIPGYARGHSTVTGRRRHVSLGYSSIVRAVAAPPPGPAKMEAQGLPPKSTFQGFVKAYFENASRFLKPLSWTILASQREFNLFEIGYSSSSDQSRTKGNHARSKEPVIEPASSCILGRRQLN